jgi:AbrB family looped-hinge helix DNA binding protein
MPTTTVSSKGQITLPAALVRERRLVPGTRLEVIATSTAIVLIPVADGTLLIDQLAGSLAGTYGDAAEYIERERGSWTRTD